MAEHPRSKAVKSEGREDRKARSMSKLTSAGAPAEAASRGSAAAERSRDQLYQRATELGINGRSRMTKERLARAIELREGETSEGSTPSKRRR